MEEEEICENCACYANAILCCMNPINEGMRVFNPKQKCKGGFIKATQE